MKLAKKSVMKLTKKSYIHSYLTFDDTERDTLIMASKIITSIHEANNHTPGEEDPYLNDLCTNILESISELLDSYSNQYADE